MLLKGYYNGKKSTSMVHLFGTNYAHMTQKHQWFFMKNAWITFKEVPSLEGSYFIGLIDGIEVDDIDEKIEKAKMNGAKFLLGLFI